jgi:hypothetical protein
MGGTKNFIFLTVLLCLACCCNVHVLAQRRHMASIEFHPSIAIGRMAEVSPYPFSFGGGYEYAIGKKMEWSVRAEIQYFVRNTTISDVALEGPTGHVTNAQIKHWNEMVLPLFSVRKYFKRNKGMVPYLGAGFGKGRYIGDYEILDPLDPEGCEPEFYLGSYDGKPWFIQLSTGVDFRLATKAKRTTSLSIGISYIGSSNEMINLTRDRGIAYQRVNRKSLPPEKFIHIPTGETHVHDVTAWFNSPLQMLQVDISIKNFFGKAIPKAVSIP